MHDATKVMLGTPGSSDIQVDDWDADPASFPAGVACRLKSDGTISLLKSDGALLGVSMGKSLSNHLKLSIARAGNRVAMRILGGLQAAGNATITSYANLVAAGADTITVGATVFTAQAGAVTPGAATFQAATSNNATAASLRAQINAHATAGALVKAGGTGAIVTLTAIAPGTAGNAIALAYADNGSSTVGATVSGAALSGGSATASFAAPGKRVYINDLTGIAEETSEFATASGAVFVSDALTGIDGEGNSFAAAQIDMGGGL